ALEAAIVRPACGVGLAQALAAREGEELPHRHGDQHQQRQDESVVGLVLHGGYSRVDESRTAESARSSAPRLFQLSASGGREGAADRRVPSDSEAALAVAMKHRPGAPLFHTRSGESCIVNLVAATLDSPSCGAHGKTGANARLSLPTSRPAAAGRR